MDIGNPHWGGGPVACLAAAQRCAQRALVARMRMMGPEMRLWELRAEYWTARATLMEDVRRTYAPPRFNRAQIENSAAGALAGVL